MASSFQKSLLLALALTPIGAHAADTYVFLLAGQSNMSGRGLISDPTKYVTNSNILSYSDGSYGTTAGISTATNLLALDYGTMNGTQTGTGGTAKTTQVGPGGFFASALLPNLAPGSNILLVNVAWGGSSSAQWLPSAVYSQSTVPTSYLKPANLYNNALNTYDAAWNAASIGGLNPVVGGILWLQGESDVGTSMATYKTNTESTLGGFRTALSAYGSTPKIVIGEIAQEVSNSANVRAAQGQIASDLGAGFASSAGLANDGLHFSSAGQSGMGQRMANAYVSAVPEPSTYGLFGAGALAVIAAVRRRRKRSGEAA